MLESNLHPEDAEVDTEKLAELTATHPAPLRLGPGGEIELDLEPARTVDELIAQMLGAVHQAQLREEWARLKVCAADDCRWAFYDTSKNRGGHWCSMEQCGNRVKNRRYRGRQAGAKR